MSLAPMTSASSSAEPGAGVSPPVARGDAPAPRSFGRSQAPTPAAALAVGTLAVLAWLGAAVSSALPGSAVGLGWAIDASQLAAKVLSFWFLLGGSAWLLARALGAARTALVAASLPAAAAVVWVACIASVGRVPLAAAASQATLALASAAVAGVACWRARDRFLAAALVGASLTGLLQVGVRLGLGVRLPAWVDLAALAHAAVCAAAFGWVVRPLARAGQARWLGLSVAGALALGAGARLGSSSEAAGHLVLVRRTLSQLQGRAEAAWVSPLQPTLTAWGLVVALASLAVWRASAVRRAGVALLVVGATGPDRPLAGLALALASATLVGAPSSRSSHKGVAPTAPIP
jgi:hypothetical protein